MQSHLSNRTGSNRRENITDWALEQFRSHYHDPSITKWDIFHYTYAVLHHPTYRERYAANLKRELPRIPFVVAPENSPVPHPRSPGVGEIGWVCADAAEQTPKHSATTAPSNNTVILSGAVPALRPDLAQGTTESKDPLLSPARTTSAKHNTRTGTASVVPFSAKQRRGFSP